MSASKPKAAPKPAAEKEVPVVDKTPAPEVIAQPPVDPTPEPEPLSASQMPVAPRAEKTTLTETATDALASNVAKNFPNPDKKVLFVSLDKGLDVPVLAGGKSFRPIFDESKTMLVWSVDKEQADDFSRHSLVKHGKIVRAL